MGTFLHRNEYIKIGIYIFGGKLFRGSEGQEREWGKLGVWGERCELCSGIWVTRLLLSEVQNVQSVSDYVPVMPQALNTPSQVQQVLKVSIVRLHEQRPYRQDQINHFAGCNMGGRRRYGVGDQLPIFYHAVLTF